MMPITAVQSNEAMDDGLPPAATDVPAWLLNRRERRMNGEIAAGAEKSSSETATTAPQAETPADGSFPLSFPPPLSRAKPPETEMKAPQAETPADGSFPLSFSPPMSRGKSKRKPPVVNLVESTVNGKLLKDTWLSRWISSQGLIGVGVSLFVHATVLVSLAFIIMSTVSRDDTVQVFGIPGDTDEIGDNILLDTTMTLDPGESGPSQMNDVGQVFDTMGSGSDIGEALHGSGGKGKGLGGDGTGDGGIIVKVPGHAQTKGSFSAWTDPRDPMPLQNYHIVIQIRVPRTIKKYRATDLTGLVTGTDRFKQEIRYKAGETFPVEDGTVEIKIFVPGGAQRVRDTIHIESKMLKEKQTFEIEF